MTDYIEDGDGRLYEVVEGSLAQGEQYALVWQDIEPQIAALEAGGMLRNDALTAALLAAGRKAVFVRRIPNSADPAPSDGVHRVYLWNTDGQGNATPGALMRALERPTASFYEKIRAGAEQAETTAVSVIDAASTAITTLTADLAKQGVTVEEAATKVAERAQAEAAKASAETMQTEAQAQIAYAADAIAAITALGPAPTGHSVERLAAKIAETRAARG